MVYTCPAFATSHFLACKHLVQEVERVPPIFFLEVRRHRTTPFWRHQTWKAIQEQSHVDEGGAEAVEIEDDDDVGGVSGREEEDKIEEVVEAREEGSTFEEANVVLNLIAEFAQGLRYQVQFRDHGC